MLDEEKKAIEVLKNKRPSEQMLISGKMCVNVLINLIEKQQKEIEELKEKRFTLFDTTVKNSIKINDKKWEDKIKEICQKKRNQIFSCTYVDEKQWKPFDRAIDAINDLEQSLLEKE